MLVKIPTKYKDKLGIIETEILNDGEKLLLEIEGIKFVSTEFQYFDIENKNDNKRFSINIHNQLDNCQLICKIPITVLTSEKSISTFLIYEITIENPDFTKNEKTKCFLSLIIDNSLITTRSKAGIAAFEQGLEQIVEQLPEEYYFKCCFGCAFSDYSVYGQRFFGEMLCFKNIKEKYLMVKNKSDYIDIINDRDREVQETYCCEEFELRKRGTGYRG